MRMVSLLNILGVLLSIFSLSMLPPVFISFIYNENTASPFVISFSITLLTGLLLWLYFKNRSGDLKTRDGFIIVVLFWVVLSFFASIPLMLASNPHLSLTNALFESVSGLTTTGASVLTNLSSVSHSIIFYRQELQFLGGMGIIVLAVAI